MPSQQRETERQRQTRWQRPSRTAARLAALLATVESRMEADGERYIRRVRQVLGGANFQRMLEAWEAGQEVPADLLPLLEADAEVLRLWQALDHVGWLLLSAQRGDIPSEHYWYANLGRVQPPKEWKL